jgi:predicted metal-dependent hydrolase
MNGEQFRRGIEEFNRGSFFECHDILEDLWMGTRGADRLFLQGMIQISVGFYHLLNDNYRGAVSQYTKGLTRLERYRPVHRGIELEPLMKAVVTWLARAERGVRGETVEIDGTKFPKIAYSPRLLLKENAPWQQ